MSRGLGNSRERSILGGRIFRFDSLTGVLAGLGFILESRFDPRPGLAPPSCDSPLLVAAPVLRGDELCSTVGSLELK